MKEGGGQRNRQGKQGWLEGGNKMDSRGDECKKVESIVKEGRVGR